MAEHTCQAVAVHCIDFRIQSLVHDYLISQFPGKDGFDRVAVAGAVKELVEEGTASFIFQQLKTSHKLHEPKVIALIQHEDCGAYGGSETLGNPEEELAFQKEQLQKAKDLLKQHFPECKIRKYFAKLSGEVTQI